MYSLSQKINTKKNRKNDEAAMSLWDLLEIEARVQRQLRRVQG